MVKWGKRGVNEVMGGVLDECMSGRVDEWKSGWIFCILVLSAPSFSCITSHRYDLSQGITRTRAFFPKRLRLFSFSS